MSFDYEAIKQDNIKEHDALVDRVGSHLTGLYSDRTHFIYELLQNAEDVEASEVKFRLYRDRLEFEHNGRLFDQADVQGICKLIFGTKKDDLTKIGKFGIGFMSVYVHTRSPEIHSGDAHFTIDNYEQPREIPFQSSTLGTLFVFPFNHKQKDPADPDESFNEISSRLKKLGTSTLLFLKHIKSISYEIDENDTGSYCRETSPYLETNFVRNVTVIGQSNQREEERWLVFEKDIEHALIPEGEKVPEGKRLTVEIAFRYVDDDSQDAPKFECLSHSQSNLVVYFPTEKETKLGFLMQGPYRTTPARDNIPQENSFNKALSKQTGDLVVEALRWLRDRNRLTVDLLRTMPLAYKEKSSHYSWENAVEINEYKHTLFEPIYDTVLLAMRDEALIPAYGRGYISGDNAKLAGVKGLPDLLDNTRLQQFFDTDEQLRWISREITRDLTPKLRSYFVDMLDIEEIDAEKFARRIGKAFLRRQSDNWIRDLYEFASESGRSVRDILKNKPIIRLQDDSHVDPFARDGKPQAYLPTEHGIRVPTVKSKVCNSERALKFLRDIGLRKPDIVDVVQKLILPKYRQDGKVDIDDEKHEQDISHIVKALKKVLRLSEWDSKRRGLIEDLKSIPFLLATNAANDVTGFRCPDKIYHRSPELEIYFGGNPDAWFLSPRYKPYMDVFGQIGVENQVRVDRREPHRWKGHVIIASPYRGTDWDPHKRGLDGFDPDCKIDGLEFALNHPNVERAKFIWNDLLRHHKHLIKGVVESCPRQDFPSLRTEEEEKVSKMGKLVREMAWLPNMEGEFVKPNSLTFDELPDDFVEDRQLASQLGVKTSYQESVDKLDAPESLKQRLKQLLEVDQAHPEVLTEVLNNPQKFAEFCKREAASAKQTNGGNGVHLSVHATGNPGTPRPPGDPRINNGGSSPAPPDPPGSGSIDTERRRDIEKLAMQAVMKAEEALGNDPDDSFSDQRGLGYDIESRTPEGCERYIEVKGHSASDGPVTLTRNELRCALNNPQQFILALVKVVDGRPERTCYLTGHSWLESVTFNLRKLLEHCQDPS